MPNKIQDQLEGLLPLLETKDSRLDKVGRILVRRSAGRILVGVARATLGGGTPRARRPCPVAAGGDILVGMQREGQR